MGNSSLDLATSGGRANAIDWSKIHKIEGEVREPYIPIKKVGKTMKLPDEEKSNRSNYKVIGNSGVTVATGIDLGQQNLDVLLMKIPDRNLRSSLKQKLAPFVGSAYRKDRAIQQLDA